MMKKIIGLLLIVLGVGLEIMWLGVCFGSVIIGILLLLFAPRILFFPFNFFFLIGLSILANRSYKEYKRERKNAFKYERFKQSKSIDSYYQTLESNKNDDLDTIKKNYRRLMKLYHYDANVSKGLSEELIKEYEGKSQKINEAYRFIKADRH
jgi:hypothetical protein